MPFRHVLVASVLAASIALGLAAGCVQLDPVDLQASPTPSATSSVSPTASPSVSPTATPSASPSPGKYRGELYPVVSVVDGDTLKITMAGKVETLRLIGIDTPETVDPRKPVQCFGPEASQRAKALLEGKQVGIEYDASQGERDKYARLLVYVFLEDGTHYNLKMIEDGFAKEYTYGKAYQYQTEFRAAEARAKEAKKGLWSPETCHGNTGAPPDASDADGGLSAGTIKIIHIEADPPGLDAENEVVLIQNTGSVPVVMTGWKLKDESGATFTFPVFTLEPQATVTIHICSGTNSASILYWGRCSATWNNNGDTGFLYDARGELHHSYAY